MSPRNWPERRSRRRLNSPAATATISMSITADMGSPAVSLPGDLVFDIFSRLPVKSVCRFRCVSRGFHALISDPAFVAAHKSHYAEPFFVVVAPFRDGRRGGGSCDLQLIDMDGSVVTVIKDVSCSRLLSTSMDDLICVTKGCYGFAQVIDPATGKVLLNLPKQYYSPQIMGFGRAIPSGAYKIVCLGRECKVLTLGDGIRWRLAQSPPTYVSKYRSSPVAVNGVMYFLLSSDPRNGELLCFDLETEEWKEIEGPEKVVGTEVWNRTNLVHITELNATLCMVQSEVLRTNIWQLDDSDKDIWIKKYTIPTFFTTYPMFLKTTRDGDKLTYCCASLGGQPQVIQVYDPHNNARAALPRLGGADAIKVGLCSLHLDRFVSTKI